MMDFPDKTFPYQLYQECRRKEKRLTISCGSHDNIDINDPQQRTFYPQKIPEGFINKEKTLRANRPALPLYDRAEEVMYPLIDRARDSLITERAEIADLVLQLKRNRGYMKSKSGTLSIIRKKLFNELKEKLDELDSGISMPDHKALTFLPREFHSLLKLYQKYRTTTEIKKVNSKYADGCLGYLPINSSELTGCLISPSKHLNQLKLSYLMYDEEQSIKVLTTQFIDTDDEIYGISADLLQNKGFVLVRQSNHCDVFDLFQERQKIQSLGRIQIDDGQLTSQCLSPYIPGECLVATDRGSVYLWSIQNGKQESIKEKEQRFYCRDQWRQAIFSSHPRQTVVADCTTVELYDLRKRDTNGLDLFALPSKFLDPDERIRVIKQITPFMYAIGTDYCLIVIDERFPGHPLLQWQHMLRSPPQYLSVTDLDIHGQIIISIASQNPMEAFSFMIQGGVHKTVQGVGSPWKLSRPDDFTKWEEICSSTDMIAVEQRFDVSSLLGLQCVKEKDGFVAYQVDTHNDIYYQVFKWTNQTGDKTFAAGPGMNDLLLDDLTKQKGKKWVQSVNDAGNELDEKSRPIADVSHFVEELILEKSSHILCPLCHSHEERDYVQSGDDIVCHCCQQSLSVGNTIVDSINEDKVCCGFNSILTSLPEVSDLSTDVLSKMLEKLWDEEDVNDLLPLRDEEVVKKLEKRKKNAVKKNIDAGLPLELLQFLEGNQNKNSTPTSQNRNWDSDDSRSSREIFDDSDDDLYINSNLDAQNEQENDKCPDSNSKDAKLSNSVNTPSETDTHVEMDHNDVNKHEDSNISNSVNTPSENDSHVQMDHNDFDRQTDLQISHAVTKEQVLKDLSPNRRRHTSVSSLSSICSFSPGFLATPSWKTKSPMKKKQTIEPDKSDIDSFDEQFLSWDDKQSFSVLKNASPSLGDGQSQTMDNLTPRKRLFSSRTKKSPSGFLTPDTPFQKRTRLKKKYVSGF